MAQQQQQRCSTLGVCLALVSCGPARQRCCMRPASKRECEDCFFFFYSFFPPSLPVGPTQWVAAAAADVAGGAASAGVSLFFHSALHYGGINETGGRGMGWREGLLGLAAHCRLYSSQSSLRGRGGGFHTWVMDSLWDDFSVAGGGVGPRHRLLAQLPCPAAGSGGVGGGG